MLTNQRRAGVWWGYRVQGARDSTNQRRVYVDQSERRSSKLDQSEPSSRHATRGTDGIKGTAPSFLPFPSVTQYQLHKIPSQIDVVLI